MQPKRILGTGVAILTLSLGAQAFAQAVPSETYIPPPVQPVPPGSYSNSPSYAPPGSYPNQPSYAPPGSYSNQPGYPAQPGAPVYVYPPGAQPPIPGLQQGGQPEMQPGMQPGMAPPGYYMPGPPPPQVRGYAMRPRIGLIIGGSITLGTMWLITALAGGISSLCDAATYSSAGPSGSCGTYWPLFIPVVGPFIQMNYVPQGDGHGLAMFGLAFDGLVQAGGLAMLIAGVAIRHRVPIYAKNWQVAPTFTTGGSGLAFNARF